MSIWLIVALSAAAVALYRTVRDATEKTKADLFDVLALSAVGVILWLLFVRVS